MDLGIKEHPRKRLKFLDPNHCLICSKTLDLNKPEHLVLKPTKEGLRTILSASEIRKDDVFHGLQQCTDELLSGELCIPYHKSCRSSYTSKSNLKHVDTVIQSTSHNDIECTSAGPSRSSRDENFNIRRDCFLCGKAYKRA